MKLVKACIALAAFAALLVVPSIASATSPQLQHPTGIAAQGWTEAGAGKGLLIQGTNVKHSNTPTETVMTTSIGNVECTTATLTGELAKNKETEIWGDITTAEFKGTPGVTPHTSHCKSPIGNVTITPSHSTNPTHEGVASLPWCVTAKGNEDTFTVRGGKCHEAARSLTFTMDTPIGVCAYQKASVTGTYTTHASAAIATISGQEFTKVTGSAFCPGSGKLDMAFTLETDTAEPTDVYIK